MRAVQSEEVSTHFPLLGKETKKNQCHHSATKTCHDWSLNRSFNIITEESWELLRFCFSLNICWRVYLISLWSSLETYMWVSAHHLNRKGARFQTFICFCFIVSIFNQNFAARSLQFFRNKAANKFLNHIMSDFPHRRAAVPRSESLL